GGGGRGSVGGGAWVRRRGGAEGGPGGGWVQGAGGGGAGAGAASPDGVVLAAAPRRFYRQPGYYAALGAAVRAVYDAPEATRLMRATGHWGPWTAEERVAAVPNDRPVLGDTPAERLGRKGE